MFKRLFVAIPLSSQILEKLEEYKKNLDPDSIKWIPQKNLHITLNFLGDVKKEQIPSLVENLNSSYFEVKPFTLKFEKITFAPPNNTPRMIWAQFKENQNYQNLYKITQDAVKNFVTKEIHQNNNRIAIPHVTMSRFKYIKNIENIKLKQPDIPDLQVNLCKLIESELNTNGSIYLDVATFNLNKT